jgi:hypothetical protein
MTGTGEVRVNEAPDAGADARRHVLIYLAGISGLAALGIPDRDPGWSCRCGGWAFRAVAMPRSKTGNNQIEALKSYQAHAEVSGD